MPALYPNYTAQDQLDDLVYGASDYPNPNQQVMPTAGVAGGYSSMPVTQPAAEPAAQYPPTSPPPAGANYVAEPQPTAGSDPFAQPAAGDYDAIQVEGNVGQHNIQQQPWSSTAAPLSPPNPAPYTGPNYLTEPYSGPIDQAPTQRGFGGMGLEQLQQNLSGRQVEPAAYPPTEPTVRQLPRTGNPGYLPTPTPTSPTVGRRLDVLQQTGQDMETQQGALRQLYGPDPVQQPTSTLGTEHPDPFLDYQRRTSDIMTLPPPTPQGANLGEGWLGGWDGLTADSRPTGDWWETTETAVTQPTDSLTALGTASPAEDWADQSLTTTPATSPVFENNDPTLDHLVQDRFGSQFALRRASPGQVSPVPVNFEEKTPTPVPGGEVGGASAPATPAQPATPKKLPPAMFVMDASGNLTSDTNAQGSSMNYIGEGGMPGAPRPLMVLGIDEQGQVTFDAAAIPESSYAAAEQRGEKAAALSNEEFDAILAAGLMKNPDGSALTPDQVAVWRENMVGVPMLAPPSWSPFIAAAPGTETPTFTPAADVAAPVAADTGGGGGWSGGYSGGGGYSRGGSYGGGGGYSRGGGGGGNWYDGGGSYPPTMPESMADFFGPDAFDSPIFDRMRGMMGSRRRGRRRGRRGMRMPMMEMPGMHPGREMPSRDVNLTVQGPVVNDELARALALRNR